MNIEMNTENNIFSNDEKLLTFEEVELKRRNEIISLCEKFDLRYQFSGEYVFIYSIDEWYFPYMKNSIPLLHKNNFNDTNKYHIQKKFDSVSKIIKYIKKHDKYSYLPNKMHKYDKIHRILIALNA